MYRQEERQDRETVKAIRRAERLDAPPGLAGECPGTAGGLPAERREKRG